MQRLVEPIDQIQTAGIHNSCWLTAVDCLCQSAMEKIILHIKRMHRPGVSERARERERASEYCAHCSRLHHRTERLIIVHTRLLSDTLENPTSLIALQSTICLTLIRLHPLASHHTATRRARYKVPRLVGKKSSVLLFHRVTLVRISQGFADIRRY
jgi:hypothetical protein